MVLQAILDPQGPQAYGKGAWALIHDLWKNDTKDLRDLFRLNGRQPVPVNLWLCTMHTPSMRRHKTRGRFYSKVRAGGP